MQKKRAGKCKKAWVRENFYLARVRVDDAHVGEVDRAPHDELLHVAPHVGEARALHVVFADEVEELDDVAQQLLRDALARGVDADLDARRAVQHRRGEHAHADGLAEAARRADEHLLLQVAPVIPPQDLALLAGELAGRLALPEDARARADEVVVEQALVVTAAPAVLVEQRERVAAGLHAREAGHLCKVCVCKLQV